ncbi:MAG: trehalose-6-phosphate synthase [Chlamydiia bacterium]|nr:trehalose-6-phosphate synthase [Chlamydiia bacterium]
MPQLALNLQKWCCTFSLTRVEILDNQQRLVIVSNRLPIVVQREQEKLHFSPGSGGLVTAMAPVLRDRGGMWIGWPGSADVTREEVINYSNRAKTEIGYDLEPVHLTQEEVNQFYYGFSNEIIWPLFHDLQFQCRFKPRYWDAYRQVNRKFANTVQQLTSSNDFIWIHDYQLMTCGQELRERGCTSPLAFFLHIPFPPIDIFVKLPWRFQILRALLEYDVIGFQTQHDRHNFVQCMRTLLPDVNLSSTRSLHTFSSGNRTTRVGAFPISIDSQAFSNHADADEVQRLSQQIKCQFEHQQIVFSVDRLDYTKGIPYRLKAIQTLLKNHPEWHQKVSFIQVVVPSRRDIPHYHNLNVEIDRLVGKINSQYTQSGWVPIHYMFRPLNRQELLAHYHASDIALVTPIKDGMNLVAKEYIASNTHYRGTLILSEFAGAAAQLHNDALLINPYDIEGVSETLDVALKMPTEERMQRMKQMRRTVKRQDIFWWVHSFLNASIHKKLLDFPVVQDYIPSEQPPTPEMAVI